MKQILNALFRLMLLVRGLSIVVQRVSVSEPVMTGHSAKLQCLWSEGSGPPLYSLRWCKDGHQFFAITVMPRRHKVAFPVTGVQVVMSASDEHLVTLANVSFDTSGIYTCEAMSDRPYFLSSAKALALNVVEVPASGPNWRGVLSVYHLEQQLRAHCHVTGSRPPANFSFWINDYQIQEEDWIISNNPRKEIRQNVWNSSSTLIVQLSADNVQKFLSGTQSNNPQMTSLSEGHLPSSYLRSHSYYAEGRRRFRGSSPSSSAEDSFSVSSSQGYSRRDRRPFDHSLVSLSLSSSSSSSSSSSRSSRQVHGFHTMSAVPSSSSDISTGTSPPLRGLLSNGNVQGPGNVRLNLTCIANVGGISLRTNTKSLVAIPPKPQYNSVSVVLRSTGLWVSQAGSSSSATLMFICFLFALSH